MEEWRTFLYYPLGLMPLVFFGLRFVIQWIQSERLGQSVVPAIFWRLSLAGNILLMLHYFIQLQYPFALLQVVNGVISWRNLNLMGLTNQARLSRQTVMGILGVAIMALTITFAGQGLLIGHIEWLRVPTKLWATGSAPQFSLQWHLLGILGSCLFASRFWVQWWEAERSQKSELGPAFWWLSLAGNILSLVYFAGIIDIVSLVNTGFGFIPAFRNLLLLRRSLAVTKAAHRES